MPLIHIEFDILFSTIIVIMPFSIQKDLVKCYWRRPSLSLKHIEISIESTDDDDDDDQGWANFQLSWNWTNISKPQANRKGTSQLSESFKWFEHFLDAKCRPASERAFHRHKMLNQTKSQSHILTFPWAHRLWIQDKTSVRIHSTKYSINHWINFKRPILWIKFHLHV